MKVIKIEEIKGVYHITLEPDWFGKLFGVESRVERYKDDGSTFVFGGGNVYLKEDGTQLSNSSWIGEEIDKFRRRF